MQSLEIVFQDVSGNFNNTQRYAPGQLHCQLVRVLHSWCRRRGCQHHCQLVGALHSGCRRRGSIIHRDMLALNTELGN